MPAPASPPHRARAEAPRPPLPGLVGRALEPLYALGLAWRSRRFDAGRGVERLPVPVVSVGNLSAGGTGKTPMVHWIVQRLLDAGERPCIAMRGYRPRGTSGPSDEALLARRAFPGVPLIAQPQRAQGVRAALQRGDPIGCVVLDDGFQHRQLARDLDIVLLDASRDPVADRLLPAGYLREPLGALRRADAVVLTHADAAGPEAVRTLAARVREVHGRDPIATASHAWTTLVGETGAVPVASLRGRRVTAVCALGNPAPFLAALEAAVDGALAACVLLPDHDPYADATVRRINDAARAGAAEVIVTTEKDWVKLERLPAGRLACPVLRPRLELRFVAGETELRERVLDAVRRGAANLHSRRP